MGECRLKVIRQKQGRKGRPQSLLNSIGTAHEGSQHALLSLWQKRKQKENKETERERDLPNHVERISMQAMCTYGAAFTTSHKTTEHVYMGVCSGPTELTL